MKSQNNNSVCLVVGAAITIIASSISSIMSCRRRRFTQTKQLAVAVENWEGEGGAVVREMDEDEPVLSRA